MDPSSSVELVLLDGGRALDDVVRAEPARGWLRLVGGGRGELGPDAPPPRPPLDVRREIEARATAALDAVLGVRAPERPPR